MGTRVPHLSGVADRPHHTIQGEIMDINTLTLADILPAEWGEPSFEPFEPCASYSAPLDCITYLRKDESARADRVDHFLTILWHPYNDDEVIGIKIKGIRLLLENLQSVVKAVIGKDMPDEKFVPLVGALELALRMQLGSELSEKWQENRSERIAALTKSYEIARGFADGVTFDGVELSAQGGAR